MAIVADGLCRLHCNQHKSHRCMMCVSELNCTVSHIDFVVKNRSYKVSISIIPLIFGCMSITFIPDCVGLRVHHLHPITIKSVLNLYVLASYQCKIHSCMHVLSAYVYFLCKRNVSNYK